MWRHPSDRQPGTHERPARRRWQPTHLRHPHAHRAVRPATTTTVTPDHTPRPHSTSQVTLDLWTIRSLPDRAEARPERGRHPSRLSPPHPGLGHGRWFHHAPGSQPGCPCSRDWLHSRHHSNRHRPRHACPREVSEVMTMPRTVDEILAHADELAARFESYEPVEADEVDATALAALRDAVAEQAQAERHVLDAIRGARDAGMSWTAIGNMVGTSGEAARQRYQPLVA